MKKILLCPPSYYDITYEINPWMHVTNKVDQKKVQEAFQTLKHIYQELGCEILEVEQAKDLPDMVYAANFGFPQNNIFIKSNFKFDERKGEAELAKKYFEKLGFTIKELPKEISWEGQGDLLVAGDKYLLGWGKRTDPEAKKYLEEFLNVEITDFKMIDPYYYHLDTCLMPINAETIAINPLSFEPEGIKKLKKMFTQVIEVGKEDNAILACNACIVDDTIVIGKGISTQLKNDFKQIGYKTKEVDMTEYLKGGGSVKCLTLEFYSK